MLEETGFNTSKLLKVDDFIEVTVGEQRVRLFIVVGAKDDTVFAPQTKKEISVCIHFDVKFYLIRNFLFRKCDSSRDKYHTRRKYV